MLGCGVADTFGTVGDVMGYGWDGFDESIRGSRGNPLLLVEPERM